MKTLSSTPSTQLLSRRSLFRSLTLPIQACVAACLLATSMPAKADSISGETTVPFPNGYQFEPFTRTMTMRMASTPVRRFLVRVYELHPSGQRSLHKVVSQGWVKTRTNYTWMRGAVSLRFKNLKGGSGIRYAITVTPEKSYRTATSVDVPSFVPSGAGTLWWAQRPLDMSYTLPRSFVPRSYTGPVEIEEF